METTMINYDAKAIIDEIIKTMKKLRFFTLEQLENELTFIPDSTLKNQCIESILNSPEIEQTFGVYHFNFMRKEHKPNIDLEFRNN